MLVPDKMELKSAIHLWTAKIEQKIICYKNLQTNLHRYYWLLLNIGIVGGLGSFMNSLSYWWEYFLLLDNDILFYFFFF